MTNGPLYPTHLRFARESPSPPGRWPRSRIGALAGMLIRRVIPAMFATLAAWSALAFATALLLRRHYEAPLITTSPNLAPSRVG